MRPKSSARGIGVRRFLLILSLIFVGIVVLLGYSLSTVANLMHRNAMKIRSGLASVRAAESLKIDALDFSRVNELYITMGDKQYLARTKEIESDIRAWLAKSRSVESDPKDKRTVDETQARLDDYVRSRTADGDRGPSKETIRYFNYAMRSLSLLVQSNVEKADQALAVSARLDERGIQLSSIGFILSCVVLAIFALLIANKIYRPLRAIDNALSEVAAGNLGVRAPEGGVSELRRIASRFNYYIDRAAEQNKERAFFLAGTTHDLRNPISAISMAIEILKSDLTSLTAEQTATFDLLLRQAHRLDALASSFLDVAQVESGQFRLNIKNVDVAKTVRDAVDVWRVQSSVHRIESEIPSSPVWLRGDEVRIDQIATNLLSNAIKYSPKGGVINVTLRKVENEVEIAIKDSGVGIEAAELERIFDPFHRVTATREFASGKGIGLWVSKRLVEAHGGRITVDSRPGQGTTFRVRLPAQPLETENSGARAKDIPEFQY